MSGLAANLHHAWRLFDIAAPDQDRRGSIFADKVLAEIAAESPPGMAVMQCPVVGCHGKPCGCFFLIHRDQDGTCPECGTVFYGPAM